MLQSVCSEACIHLRPAGSHNEGLLSARGASIRVPSAADQRPRPEDCVVGLRGTSSAMLQPQQVCGATTVEETSPAEGEAAALVLAVACKLCSSFLLYRQP